MATGDPPETARVSNLSNQPRARRSTRWQRNQSRRASDSNGSGSRGATRLAEAGRQRLCRTRRQESERVGNRRAANGDAQPNDCPTCEGADREQTRGDQEAHALVCPRNRPPQFFFVIYMNANPEYRLLPRSTRIPDRRYHDRHLDRRTTRHSCAGAVPQLPQQRNEKWRSTLGSVGLAHTFLRPARQCPNRPRRQWGPWTNSV